jgi:hypothetical protein
MTMGMSMLAGLFFFAWTAAGQQGRKVYGVVWKNAGRAGVGPPHTFQVDSKQYVALMGGPDAAP